MILSLLQKQQFADEYVVVNKQLKFKKPQAHFTEELVSDCEADNKKCCID